MNSDRQPLPSQEFLHQYLVYDDTHGHLYWRARTVECFGNRRSAYLSWTTQRVFRRADHSMLNGYQRVRFRIDGRMITYQAHRVIWKMAYGYDPLPCIDHIDRDPQNNRLFNLRVATHSENMINRTIRRKRAGGSSKLTT